MRRALYAGSFDPFTTGHAAVLEEASALFDEVIIGIGDNTEKRGFFPRSDRQELIHKYIERALDPRKVTAVVYAGLTVEYALKTGCEWIVRGIRGVDDVGQESILLGANERADRILSPSSQRLRTVWIPKLDDTSSTLVRVLLKQGGPQWQKLVLPYIPPCIAEEFFDMVERHKIREKLW